MSDAALPAALEALRGCTVTRFVVDDALTLALQSAGREASVRIDGSGRLLRDGKVLGFSPDTDPASLGPVLGLLHERVAGVTLAPDGTLAMAFAGGARLELLSEDHHIAWAVTCGTASAACIAEGKVVWE